MINKLINLVGQPCSQYDKDKNVMACFEPIYLIYPHLPRYPLPKVKNLYKYALTKLKENLAEIKREDIKTGDIIVFKDVFRSLHIAIYIDKGLILHCGINYRFEIVKLLRHEANIYGIFRPYEK